VGKNVTICYRFARFTVELLLSLIPIRLIPPPLVQEAAAFSFIQTALANYVIFGPFAANFILNNINTLGKDFYFC
jgi:hypothetical protein